MSKKRIPNIGDAVAVHDCISLGISETVDTIYGILLKKPYRRQSSKYLMDYKVIIYINPTDRENVIVHDYIGTKVSPEEARKITKDGKNSILPYPKSLSRAIMQKTIIALPLGSIKKIETTNPLNKSDQEILPGDDVFILQRLCGQWNSRWRCIKKYVNGDKEKFLIENIGDVPLKYDRKIFLLEKNNLIRISRRDFYPPGISQSKTKIKRRLVSMLDN